MRHAVKRGVTPIAAIGNSDTDLAQSAEPEGDDCDVVPAETPGVTATVALGPDSEKAGYSSYGSGAADVSAPGGNAIVTGASCADQILATIPGGYGCLQGTSMASPHAAGVAALVVSRIGKLSGNGDVKSSPSAVADRVMSSVVDIGLAGYDECFGHGRIDALRAVTKDQAAELARNILGMTLVTPQTGPEGRVVRVIEVAVSPSSDRACPSAL